MSLDITALLNELTLAEKASLTSGSAFWYTAPVERQAKPLQCSLALTGARRTEEVMVRTHNQNMTVAAMQMAERKSSPHLS